MKILFNAGSRLSYGGLQTSISLLEHLVEFAGRENVVAALWRGADGNYSGIDVEKVITPGRLSTPLLRRGTTRILNRVCREFQPDIVFSPFGPGYWQPPHPIPHMAGFAMSQLVFPVGDVLRKMSLLNRGLFLLKFNYYMRVSFKKYVDYFWCESEAVKRNLSARLGIPARRIVVATNTCNRFFQEIKTDMLKFPPRAGGEFRVLTLSDNEVHKNLAFLQAVAPLLRDLPIRFFVTLKSGDFESLFGKFGEQFYNLGTLRPDECPSAYANCDMLFAPSLLECFSANYPEAMKMERPLLAADLPFAVSSCGEAALYFDPSSAEDAADKLRKLYSDGELRRKLCAKGALQLLKFNTPQERAKILYDFMGEIVNRHIDA